MISSGSDAPDALARPDQWTQPSPSCGRAGYHSGSGGQGRGNPKRSNRVTCFMRGAGLAIVASLLAACSQPSTGPQSTAATPTASAVVRPLQPSGGIPSFAVLASNPVVRAPGQTSYTVELVAPDGHVAASRRASLPSAMPQRLVPPTPLVSSSDTRLYFLNGDTEVRFLQPDGVTGIATHLPGSGQVHAAFAVSPADRRIAVSLLDYSSQPIHLRMYVEDLAGGGNHVDIFSATNGIAEWPVGWRDGDLVVAVGPIAVQNVWPNPYNAGNSGGPGPNDAYHLVDPATGNRLAAIGSDCNFGPLTVAGTGCRSASGAADLTWDGQRHGFVRPDNVEPGPVSPDGAQMAGAGQQSPFPIMLLSASTRAAGVAGNPLGWIDGIHLVIGTLSGTSLVGNAILDTVSGRKAQVDTQHEYLSFFGTLPGGLSASDHVACWLPFGGLIDSSPDTMGRGSEQRSPEAGLNRCDDGVSHRRERGSVDDRLKPQ